MKLIRLRQRMTSYLTSWYFGYGKGIPNVEQTTTQGMAVPHKWVSCLESAYSTLASWLHQALSKFIRIIILFHGLLAYMTLLGLHQCLKAQLIAAFIQDIFNFIRLVIFGYSIYLTISFGTFSYTLQGVFLAFHWSCPFSHMLRNTV